MILAILRNAFAVLLLPFLFLPLQAQEAGPSKAPRIFRAVRSPEVHGDGSVTFRFRALSAKGVSLHRDGGNLEAMTLGEDGVWSLHTPPLAPGFSTYAFIAGGVPLADPSNELAVEVAVGGHESILHVPGPNPLPWEVRDVPHGVLHRHAYLSTVAGEARDYWVYTPPGFDPKASKPYPVLYLLHGVMDTATAWLTAGRAPVILDNLVSQGKARPMIVVFPLGYGFPDVPDCVGDLLTGAMDPHKALDTFSRILLDEIAPQVERGYPVARGRQSRAIAGLSMGGAQALHLGLNHPERFTWVGAFSAATPMFRGGYSGVFPALEAGANPRLRLLWVSIGREDFLLGPNRDFSAWLATKGMPSAGGEGPGAHAWSVWHRDLADFLPLLFRNRPSARRASPRILAD